MIQIFFLLLKTAYANTDQRALRETSKTAYLHRACRTKFKRKLRELIQIVYECYTQEHLSECCVGFFPFQLISFLDSYVMSESEVIR